MFGFTGAHRSGKTTLAKNISELSGIPFVNSSVTELMKKAGYNGVADLNLEDRIKAQEQLLTFYLEILDKAPRPFITDRTPLDMIAYTMGELTMHNSSPELGSRYAAYLARCLHAVRDNFSRLFITRPLVSYAADPTKPPENLGYQMLIQLLTEGSAMMCKTPATVIITEDHNDRVEFVLKTIQGLLEETREAKGKMH